MIDSFVEFAPVPFLMTTVAGLGLAGLGLLGGFGALLAGAAGWAFVLAAVFFVGGLQLAALGGFGEYLWRAGDDARRRPLYVLRGVRDWGTPGQVTAWEPADVDARTAPVRP
jgi:dolichol-phosphate mannosyltransferase